MQNVFKFSPLHAGKRMCELCKAIQKRPDKINCCTDHSDIPPNAASEPRWIRVGFRKVKISKFLTSHFDIYQFCECTHCFFIMRLTRLYLSRVNSDPGWFKIDCSKLSYMFFFMLALSWQRLKSLMWIMALIQAKTRQSILQDNSHLC